MATAHIYSAFDEELATLSRRIAEMGGMAEQMVSDSVRALVASDAALAQRVISVVVFLVLSVCDIGDNAILMIAKRQPVAADLREIVGSIRIAADLERVGDLGKNVAKRVVAVTDGRQPTSLFRGLEALANLALTQLKEVLDGYASRSVDKIGFVRDRDDQIDSMYTSLFRELLTYLMEDPRNITPCTHLLFCAKNIERIGDNATNIDETVFYMIEGQPMLDQRPKGDMTTFATTVPGK